ncbi:MAG TPA: small ribosomal subunit biogenesis GTPase RsgA [Coleofasciculaceae cyanobacterium]
MGTDHPVESDLSHGDVSLITGTVLAIQANYYSVKLDGLPKAFTPLPTQPLLCTRRARLKKIGQQVMVGDRVVIEETDWVGQRGAISQVFPRQSELDRPPVANANQILLVFALSEPDLDPLQLSRFLVKTESTGLQVYLCLSKQDLVDQSAWEYWQMRIQRWGYDPLPINVRQGNGLNPLLQQLNHRLTVVSGPSGVGKSSLINALIPQVNLRVGDVSGKLARGRHTTRHVELFELPNGGLLADTPGFNQPDLNCTPKELAYYFPEARQRLAEADCQFDDCLHWDEPNCVVRGEWERYVYYLRFLQETIARQSTLEKQGGAESTIKVKSGRDGRQQVEPKLDTRKYRRQSRRSQHQEIQVLHHDLERLTLEQEEEPEL